MSNINDYWSLAQASDKLGISKASLTAWRLEAVDVGWHEMDEPDAKFGSVRLWHKDKWSALLGVHYAKDIVNLSSLGLVFTVENAQRAILAAQDLGRKEGYEEGYRDGLEGASKPSESMEFVTESIEELKAEFNEPLVAYATTKGPNFGKLTDGHGFQSIV